MYSALIGAICGDIIGSSYEFNPVKSINFQLFTNETKFTDDTVMNIALAEWFTYKKLNKSWGSQSFIETIQRYGRKYIRRGFGRHFMSWLTSSNPRPYNSYGNGGAMKVAPIIDFATSLQSCIDNTKYVTEFTHNHPESLLWSEIFAACGSLIKNNKTKEEIIDYIKINYDIDLNKSYEDICIDCKFSTRCKETVPKAIICWLTSNSYEETIRKAINLKGDADTMACMAGTLAGLSFGVPNDIVNTCIKYLPKQFIRIINLFNNYYNDCGSLS